MRTHLNIIVASLLLTAFGCSSAPTPEQALADSSGVEFRSARPNMVVSDLDQSSDFYTKKLGFAVTSHGSDYVVVAHGNIELSLVRSSSGAGKSWCYLKVTDPTRLYKDYKALDVKIVEPLKEGSEHAEFTVADPDGNRIDVGN